VLRKNSVRNASHCYTELLAIPHLLFCPQGKNIQTISGRARWPARDQVPLADGARWTKARTNDTGSENGKRSDPSLCQSDLKWSAQAPGEKRHSLC
jgi:hypothetical protein